MSKFLSLFFAVPLALVMVVFSLINRHFVTLSFWPFPMTVEMPLFALILVTLAIGVLCGGLAAWIAAGKSRKRARELNHRLDAAELDLRHLEEQNARLQAEQQEVRRDVQKNNLLPPADAA